MKLPLVHFFETSFGRIDDKHFILVRVDGGGATGYGECVAEQDPYYSAETNETVWHIIADFIARPAFASQYNPLGNSGYVDALINTAAVNSPNRQSLIDSLNNGTATRAA